MSPVIGLGSNVGDRLGYLRAAVRALDETPGIELVSWSSVYDTDPVGPDQPNFLNAVVAVDTTLSARQLFERLKEIERELGRVQREAQGPREIDLDLLLFGDEVIDEPDLQVPHPRMAERAFVLVPLIEIDPTLETIRNPLGEEAPGVRRTSGELV